MNRTDTRARLDYLDAVRAFALLLGIVFHAGLSLLPMYIGWAVMDVSTSGLVAAFTLVSHSFRMELFFLIAGFFSRMTFHGKGAAGFLSMRLVRIGIPFVIGWFLLRPLVVSGWIMGGESLRGDVDILAGLVGGFATLLALPKDLFVGTHLWFLYYLMLITAITLLARWVLKAAPAVDAAVTRFADKGIAWISTSSLGLIALAIPTAGALWFMAGWGMDTPDQSLVPDLPVLAIYGGCFAFGWLLHRQQPLLGAFARLTASRWLLCAAAVAASLVLAGFQSDPGHPQLRIYRAAFVISYALMMWSLVALSIGVFKRFFDRPSRTVRYVADASYWLYLVHLPIVVWLQVAVAELPFHWSLKWVAVSGITMAVSLLLYDLFVRSTIIGKTLNGRRKTPAWQTLATRRQSQGREPDCSAEKQTAP